MVGESTYRECLGMPKNEDHTCSNGVRLENGWLTVQRYINDHLNYFGQKVSYLKLANSQIKIFGSRLLEKLAVCPLNTYHRQEMRPGLEPLNPNNPLIDSKKLFMAFWKNWTELRTANNLLIAKKLLNKIFNSLSSHLITGILSIVLFEPLCYFVSF